MAFKNWLDLAFLQCLKIQPDKVGQVSSASFSFVPPPSRKVTHIQLDGEARTVPGPFEVHVSHLRAVKFLFYNENPVKNITSQLTHVNRDTAYRPLDE